MNIELENVEHVNVTKIFITSGWFTAAELSVLIKRLQRLRREMKDGGRPAPAIKTAEPNRTAADPPKQASTAIELED